MAGSAFILGGTGQIGRAVARQLADHGWRVTVTGREPAHFPSELAERDVLFAQLDRSAGGELAAALGDGVDVLVDVIPYRLGDAEQLLSLRSLFGSLIVVSSASVYADEHGRTFDDQEAGIFPAFPVPIFEEQPTAEPGGGTYSTGKVAVERALLAAEDMVATIVRPGAVYGPGSSQPREWYFVKRALDGRRFVVLARRGEAIFHTISTENLAELIRLAAERPGRRVLNCGDPGLPTVLEIARAIADALDHEWVEVLLPGDPPSAAVGDNPWQAPKPFVLDMSAAEAELGYRPVVSYPEAVRETCAWLVAESGAGRWRNELPPYMGAMFDYAAEDAFLASLTAE